MKRRTALKMMGALVAGIMGHAVMAEDKESGSVLFKDTLFTRPMDYIFHEEGLGNIIIERKSGKKLIIPFSDIFDALEGK